MYELKIITEFSAAHNLRNFRGKCEALHGHNWKVEVVVSGKELDNSGVVLDFAEVKSATGEIMSEIARYIFQRLQEKIEDKRVRVKRVTAWESQDA
jgi:6-pyruvoyltetrahydropterin/6-carboxytetrahydropterin synthase